MCKLWLLCNIFFTISLYCEYQHYTTKIALLTCMNSHSTNTIDSCIIINHSFCDKWVSQIRWNGFPVYSLICVVRTWTLTSNMIISVLFHKCWNKQNNSVSVSVAFSAYPMIVHVFRRAIFHSFKSND